ncbi:Ganglioside-induced differentiation-associated protein 2 [Phytophthora boehmeriae]|uniref:Ganglioside-induced differentiation-associated protein 2 n=1 Tax=Phytophthora boehmeriae TaxID=109152 RepID=A0A8T1V2J4_9STRA|nr:Ganglioside-induced differentiation-associated protein 2 [Phytophthora boehmeriae]
MVSTRSSISLLAACAFALQGHVDADPCGADNYSAVAAAVQTLHANCASWAAHLASGGVWQCDSTCKQSVVNLVDTLPDCHFGGPNGQNYKDVVEGMIETCNGAVSGSTTAPSATAATPTSTTATPSATTAAPTGSAGNSTETVETPAPETTAPSTTTESDTQTTATTETTNSASTSGSAGVADTPASDVSTTSGASSQSAGIVAPLTAMVLFVAGALMH